MQPDVSSKKWPLTIIIGIICAIVLMALITRSLVRLFSSSPESASEQSAVAASTVADKTALQPDVKSISAFGEHPIMSPGSTPAAVRSQPKPTPAPAPARAVFNTEFQGMQERAKARRATIENMRKTIRSGEKDTNTIMQQEKKLQKIEDSGDSFM